MRDYITLGPTPADEDCAQIGESGYYEKAKKECSVYINQMTRILAANGWPKEKWPEGFNLVVKSSAHDFGTYHEVNVRFDSDDEKSSDLAYFCDGLIPAEWDEEAKKELGSIEI